ncbi:hypothetical protein PVT68_03095 [Microbulbifer bruguierae]|uniref:Sulfotransferase domain-containing protein n=1 Tax=Microbulbifer bruguierae TaxID=3029061 RepID=A0ABY8NEE6_9GAMM|nr:hypothetical protein [Microbulbifer bruguierae]WGL17295.1 hypothetical protein PVT68_03095 [Microbulbifer bruguierae]
MDRPKEVKPGVGPSSTGDRSHERTAIIVLGMHRSGTSAWTRCLNLIGADLPRHVFGVASGNETGHWEAEKLIEFNNELLKVCGSRWDDWRPINFDSLPRGQLDSYKIKLEKIIREEFGSSDLILIKDPRICRLADIYIDVLSSMGIEPRIVIPYRDPLAVVESLKKRDGMTDHFSVALWLRHLLDAERFSAGKKRVFVSYDELISDTDSIIDDVRYHLELEGTNVDHMTRSEISKFLSPSLRHHMVSIEKIDALPILLSWAKVIYVQLTETRSGESPKFRVTLKNIRADFDKVCETLGDVFFFELQERERKYSTQVHEQARTVDRYKENLVSCELDLKKIQEQIFEKERELATCKERIILLSKENEKYGAELEQARSRTLAKLVSRIKQHFIKVAGKYRWVK